MSDELQICHQISQRYPNYTYDFQILVNERTGDIYHLDFDRAFEKDIDLRRGNHDSVLQRLSELIQRVNTLAAEIVSHTKKETNHKV